VGAIGPPGASSVGPEAANGWAGLALNPLFAATIRVRRRVGRGIHLIQIETGTPENACRRSEGAALILDPADYGL
jgi:hypothetical protein